MPIYSYQVVNDDGSLGETIDLIHGMDEPSLTEHPETGQKIQRVFTAPHIAGWGNSRVAKEMTSDDNLDRLGFTKYVRNGKGHYEKRTGQGPDSLHTD
ncbi:MAG: FmdB family transcriptional regulator [Candidatus Hydrogenedentes bacterium]|nr:FmdB family transcriptional regulator [Candidatus Hydrogenedentota bacterium]